MSRKTHKPFKPLGTKVHNPGAVADRQATRAFNTGSKIWLAIRKPVLIRDAYTCQMCGAWGNQVDHKDGDDSNNDPSNLWTLCGECHSRKTMLELKGIYEFEGMIPPHVELTVVCGPPGAGKTEYIRKRLKADDIAIDDDLIAERLFGKTRYQLDDEQQSEMNSERFRLIGKFLSGDSPRCWLAANAGSFKKRKLWAERGANVIILGSDHAACRERIEADATRSREVRVKQLVQLSRWN